MVKIPDMKKTVKVYVEKAEDGTYWGTTQNVPGVVSANAKSLEALKKYATGFY